MKKVVKRVALLLMVLSPLALSAADHIVFIHGWNSSADTWNRFIGYLTTKDEEGKVYITREKILPVDYAGLTGMISATSIETIAENVANQIAQGFPDGTCPYQMDFVVHSMGGLILRYMVANRLIDEDRIGRVVTLATPHYGQGHHVPFGGSEQAEEMLFGSEFIWNLANADIKISPSKVLCVGGSNDLVVDEWSAALVDDECVGTRYVRKVHSTVPLYYFGTDENAIYYCREGRNDPVYRLVTQFLSKGTVSEGSSVSTHNVGAILFQVLDGKNNPVAYKKNGIVNAVRASVVDSSGPITSYVAEYPGDSVKKGIGAVHGYIDGNVGVVPGNYVLDIVESKDKTFSAFTSKPIPVERGRTTVVPIYAENVKPLDFVFLIDSTGSMSGDINSVKASARQLIQQKLGEGARNCRVAIADYRDYPISPYGDSGDYTFKMRCNFTTNATAAINALNAITTGGGGDTEEAVLTALYSSIVGFDWNPEAAKTIMLMGDAGPHNPEPWTGGHSSSEVLALAKERGVSIYPMLTGYNSSLATTFEPYATETGGKVVSSSSYSSAAEAVQEVIEQSVAANGFETEVVNVDETSGSVTVRVFGGNKSSQASVGYQVVSGSAVNGKDYSALGSVQRLSWAMGERAYKTITIPVMSDTGSSDDKFFSIILSDPVNMGLGGINVCRVNVLDRYSAGTSMKDRVYVQALSRQSFGGSVSGSGAYVLGETITLQAIAASGYVFTSWEDGSTSPLRTINSRDAQVVAEGGVATYVASFMKLSDLPLPEVTSATSASGKVGETFNWRFDYYSPSAATVTCNGLPSGFTFANGVVSGTATSPSTWTATFTVANAKGSVNADVTFTFEANPLFTFSDTYSTVAAFAPNGATEVDIPRGVVAIGERAFENCATITSVKIPSTVTSIGKYAFSGCTGLTVAWLPRTLEGHIDSSVFAGCSGCLTVQYYDVATVTFDARGGDLDNPIQKFAIGEPFGELPELHVNRWKFLGWYATLDGDGPISNETIVSGDATYYAMWEADTESVDLGFYDVPGWEQSFFLSPTTNGLTHTTTFEVGDPVYMRYAFINAGGFSAVSNFVVRFTLDSKSHFDYEWEELDENSWGWCGMERLPDMLQNLPIGAYTLTCNLDADDSVAETDEGNNEISLMFEVVPSTKPNLAIMSLSASRQSITLSEPATVHWRVTNDGKGSADKSKIAFLTYKYDDTTENYTLVKTEWIDCLPLAAGGSQEFMKTITVKTLGEGTYSFVVVADGQENIVERDETDNIGAVATVVANDNATSSKSNVDWQFNKIKGEADSFFLSASSDMKKKATTFKVGQPIYMRCCWWNAKKGAVSGNAMRVRVVMNGSSGVYTDRSYFEKNYYYYFSSKNPDFLQNLPAGNYTLTAVLDSENAWLETDEKNNVKTISFTVVGMPKIFCEMSYTCALNEPVSWPVTIDGKATLTGLPSGLKYSDGTITGKATKAGTYTVNISTKNEAGSATKSLTIHVVDPGFIVSCSAQSNGSSVASNVASGGTVEMYAGVNQTITLSSIPGKADVANADATVTAKGLPAGLKLSGGKIIGVPTKAGSYAVNVSFKNKLSWTSSFLLNIVVHPLPDWAVGNFEGFVSLDENDGGFATMSVAAAGKISGKISYGGTNWTFKADSFAVASETVGYTNFAIRTVATAGKATLELSLNMVDFIVDSLPSSTTSFAEGYFGEIYTMMYRLPWKDKGDVGAAALVASYAGAYSCTVQYDDETGDVAFVLDEKGAVKGTVVLPDGAKTRKATFSCNVLPNYDSLSVVIAVPPDLKKGYPAVFKVVNLVNHSGEGADNLAFRDPGVVAAVAELTAESGATGTVLVNPKYGQVAPGKDVTLTAKAAKGSVFHRWEITGVDTEGIDLSSSTLKIKMTDTGDVFAKAVFVTAEEDAASIALSVDALGGAISPEAIVSVTNTCGVALKWSVAADALSKPVVAVTGLPSGLKFTAKDIMKKGSKTEIDIPANTIYGAPTAASKIDKKTGLPIPSVVKITVTTASKSSVTYLVNIVVDSLPAWAVGNFEGFVRHDEDDGGFASMSVTTAGKISGKIAYGGTNWTFKADSYDIASETVGYTNFAVKAVAASGKATLDFSLAITKDGVDYLPDSAVAFGEGNFGDMPAEMHRLPWKDKNDTDAASLIASYAGAYSCKVPYGRDAAGVTFVLDEKGAVKGTVVLPDGTKTRKATFSCNVLPNYDSFSVVIALPPDFKKGYPAVFKIVELVNCSGEGSDGMAYRDPGVIVNVDEYFTGSGATGTVSVSPKYGQVSSGKSVTITAKPAKGSVFHCWKIKGVGTDGLNLTEPTLKFVMPGESDVYATAVFATVEDDIVSFSLDVPPSRMVEPGGMFLINLTDYVNSLSRPQITVKGLPSGLKYDPKTMTISGSITKNGKYTVMLTGTNASVTGKNAIVGEFVIIVQESEVDTKYTSISDFEWVYTSCGVEITKYLGEDFNVNIPPIIDNLPVVSIGEWSFFGCASLESVHIPDSVTSIGIAAFDDCPNLESINIPKGVSVIEGSLFSKCHSLKSIVIPEGVTSIGESAFYHCNSLTELVIPNSVTNIDSGAFAYCSSLTNVIREGNGAISVGGGAFADCPGLINDDEFFIVMDVLCGYFGEGGDVVIPEGVTSIAENVFFWCDSLTSVTIPDSVAVIGSGAFKECPGLADEDGFVIVKGILFDYFGEGGNVVIPQGVVKIDSGAFEREDGPVEIKNIVIPESVTSIEEYAFESSLLTEIVFWGNAPILCGDVFYDVNENCTAYVRPGSIGWGVTIPGVWNNIYITYEALR